jgi:transcriptional regulator with GAF, ATPase, and Fis domain
LLRVAAVTTTKIKLTAKEAPASETATEHRVENAPNPSRRFAVSTISGESPTTSGQEPIAPQSASEVPSECLYVKRDEHESEAVSRGTIVTNSDELSRVSYQQTIERAAKQYLVAVLEEAGGERWKAAQLAGLNRTHLQALIRKHAIDVPMNPKARGRWARRSVVDS